VATIGVLVPAESDEAQRVLALGGRLAHSLPGVGVKHRVVVGQRAEVQTGYLLCELVRLPGGADPVAEPRVGVQVAPEDAKTGVTRGDLDGVRRRRGEATRRVSGDAVHSGTAHPDRVADDAPVARPKLGGAAGDHTPRAAGQSNPTLSRRERVAEAVLEAEMRGERLALRGP